MAIDPIWFYVAGYAAAAIVIALIAARFFRK